MLLNLFDEWLNYLAAASSCRKACTCYFGVRRGATENRNVKMLTSVVLTQTSEFLVIIMVVAEFRRQYVFSYIINTSNLFFSPSQIFEKHQFCLFSLIVRLQAQIFTNLLQQWASFFILWVVIKSGGLFIILKRFDRQTMDKAVDEDILFQYVRCKGLSEQFQKFFRCFNIPSREKCLNMTFIKLQSLCRKLNKIEPKDEAEQSRKKNAEWKKGEYKLFLWFSAFYMFNRQITPFQLDQSDFDFFKTIFLKKAPERIKYQLQYLYSRDKIPWLPEETELFKKLVYLQSSASDTMGWKNIAYKLFLESKGVYFKTFSQCRQMWSNHLDPKVNKNKWSYKEDALLMSLVSQNNKSWSKIAQKFNRRRTVHMVKNRYNSLLRKKEKIQRLLKKKQEEVKESSLQEPISEVRIEKENGPFEYQVYPNHVSFDNVDQEFERIKEENQLFQFQNRQELFSKEKATQLSEFNQDQNNQKVAQKIQTSKSQIDSFIKNVKLMDINLMDTSRYYNQSNLLQKLGCSHFQQIPDLLQSSSSQLSESQAFI